MDLNPRCPEGKPSHEGLTCREDHWEAPPSKPMDERLDPDDWSLFAESTPHGIEGHTGWRCRQCAMESQTVSLIASDTGEYWQNMQLAWQEECDRLQNEYDDANAKHLLEDHVPKILRGKDETCNCPVPAQMPIKPNPPAERAWKHRARNNKSYPEP